MIDPFTAVAAATTAFNTVKKFVHAGQEFENCMGQMGKWYTSVSDFRKGQQMEKELQQMLNIRFGFGTWDELKEMQRKIRAKREREVYKQAEAKQALINGVAITLLLGALVSMLGGLFYFILKAKGMI